MAQATRKRQVNGQIGHTMTEIEKSIIQNITMANIRATLTMDMSFDKKMNLILDYIQNYEQMKERELLKGGTFQLWRKHSST